MATYIDDDTLAKIVRDGDQIAEQVLKTEGTVALLGAMAERLAGMPERKSDLVLDAMAEMLAQTFSKRAGRSWAEFQLKPRLVGAGDVADDEAPPVGHHEEPVPRWACSPRRERIDRLVASERRVKGGPVYGLGAARTREPSHERRMIPPTAGAIT